MKRLRSLLLDVGMYLTVVWCVARYCCAAEQEPGGTPPAKADDATSEDADASQTLGGVAFWRDELFFHQWRIQRNVFTGHCRLLDGDDRRYESGTFEECQTKLDEIRTARKLPAMKGRAVILMHGLGAIRGMMSPLASSLEKRGYQVFNVSYPSTRSELAEHAKGLASVVSNLDGIEEIHFVCHSMGGLVVRRWLGDCRDGVDGCKPDPRLKRIVMLATPNHGAERAMRWGHNVFFMAVAGTSALEMGAAWNGVEKMLATPDCEFGIIAGGRGNADGFSTSIEGDGAGLICVETTRLEGAQDFVLLPYQHTVLLFKTKTHEHVAQFLATGSFRKSNEREPIAVKVAAGGE